MKQSQYIIIYNIVIDYTSSPKNYGFFYLNENTTDQIKTT